MKKWNVKEIKKEISKLSIPKKYLKTMVDIDVLVNHDITMLLSIREDAGKTTQALLLGMIINKIYGTHVIYQRSDRAQTTKSKIDTMFNTIKSLGYIDNITDGKYNDIIYKQQEHKFYYCLTTVIDGNLYKEVSNDYFCHVVCLEDYELYKSTVNDSLSDFIIYDEFMDTRRSTQCQMVELMNNISTFLRPKSRTVNGTPIGHVLMLGNNTNKYNFWFEEFCIEQDIVNLKFDSFIDRKTELGTTFACYLLGTSEELKETVTKRKIHFFGFNTPKMNAFNGLQEWQSEAHPHLPNDTIIKDSTLNINYVWVKHRNRYVKLDVYYNINIGYFIFAHFGNPKDNKPKIIYTQCPLCEYEFYGFGNYEFNKNVSRIGAFITSIARNNKIYFSSNSVGDLFANYCTEISRNKNYF